MISLGGALGRAGKTKNGTPHVAQKDEKKKTGRAKMRSKPHETNAMAKSTEFDKQEFTREKREHHAIRYRTGSSDAIKNTKKPNNLEYKHETNSHREEVYVTSEQLENEGWTVVGER